jgi:hypothetical protein
LLPYRGPVIGTGAGGTGVSAAFTRWPLVGATLIITALITSAGCDSDASRGPGRVSQWPAAAAGGACQLLDYDSVAAQIGTRFDTAGAAAEDETYTCALTLAGQDYPDLTLAVTATEADEAIFTATVTPSGSTAVKGLGRVGYRIGIAASAKSGPGVEVGWLSGNGRVMIMRYTFAARTSGSQVDELTPKLIALAKHVDQIGATAGP